MLDLEDKLWEAERRCADYQKDLKSMARIQNDQGKALEKIVNEGDYVNKIKYLQDELRKQKEKCKDLEDRLKREEKNSM